MTPRERIEQAASELEQAASNEDEGVTLTWNRTTAINFALGQVEKTTAELQEEIDDLKGAVKDEAALRRSQVEELEQADRQAREDCAKVLCTYYAVDDCGAARAIRATIKETK